MSQHLWFGFVFEPIVHRFIVLFKRPGDLAWPPRSRPARWWSATSRAACRRWRAAGHISLRHAATTQRYVTHGCTLHLCSTAKCPRKAFAAGLCLYRQLNVVLRWQSRRPSWVKPHRGDTASTSSWRPTRSTYSSPTTPYGPPPPPLPPYSPRASTAQRNQTP